MCGTECDARTARFSSSHSVGEHYRFERGRLGGLTVQQLDHVRGTSGSVPPGLRHRRLPLPWNSLAWVSSINGASLTDRLRDVDWIVVLIDGN